MPSSSPTPDNKRQQAADNKDDNNRSKKKSKKKSKGDITNDEVMVDEATVDEATVVAENNQGPPDKNKVLIRLCQSVSVLVCVYVYVCLRVLSFRLLIFLNHPSHQTFIHTNQQDNSEIVLLVSRRAKFSKMFAKYAEEKGYQGASLKFQFNGRTVDPTTTPKILMEREDDDVFTIQTMTDGIETVTIQIDCFLENYGG
jgi:hypothetical protein